MPVVESPSVLSIAAAQWGVVTRQQARTAGLSDSAISRRVAAGAWQRLHHRVFLVGTEPPDLMATVLAARLWVGDGSTPVGVVAGHTAARMWGMDGERRPAPVELQVPRTIRRRQPPGVRLRWRPLAPSDVALCRGVPCVRPPQLLADLSTRLDLPAVLVRADAALRLRRCTLAELAMAAGPRPRGARRALLVADGRAESPFESLVRAELMAAGLPAPHLQHVVVVDGRIVARLDFAWPGRMLAVEADGASVHASAGALRADVRRQNALVGAGWTVLRFTWADLGRIAPVVAAALGLAARRSA